MVNNGEEDEGVNNAEIVSDDLHELEAAGRGSVGSELEQE